MRRLYNFRSNFHVQSAIFGAFGGLCIGIPLYKFSMGSATKHRDVHVTTDTSSNRYGYLDTSLIPSFKVHLLYKLWNFQFSEITKSEVLIECLLLSLPLLCTATLSYRLYAKTHRNWSRRYFYDSINISLNTVTPASKNNVSTIKNYDLRVRTIIEKDIRHIVPNEEGIKLLIDSAKKTTKENPFIEIENEIMRRSINNLIRDHITALSNQAYIAEDLLNKTDSDDMCARAKYLMVITVWPQQDQFNKKIRVMLFKKDSVKMLMNEVGLLDELIWMNTLKNGFPETWKLLYKISRKFQQINHFKFRTGIEPYVNQVELAITNNNYGEFSTKQHVDTV
eukprot:154070_1